MRVASVSAERGHDEQIRPKRKSRDRRSGSRPPARWPWDGDGQRSVARCGSRPARGAGRRRQSRSGLKVRPPQKAGVSGIVIAAEPNPLANGRAKRGQLLLIGASHAVAREAIVEAVAEANDALRAVGFDRASQAMERVAAVERGQEASLGRGARALFEMQVRENERAVRARIGGAGGIERQRKPSELDLDCGLASTRAAHRQRIHPFVPNPERCHPVSAARSGAPQTRDRYRCWRALRSWIRCRHRSGMTPAGNFASFLSTSSQTHIRIA